MSVEYTTERKQFGVPIGSFQASRHKCADLRVDREGSRTFARYAALAVEEGFEDVAEAVHAAKSHIGEATSRIAGEALQIHGGVGFTWEYDVHVFLRRAKCNEMLWGYSTSGDKWFPQIRTAQMGWETRYLAGMKREIGSPR